MKDNDKNMDQNLDDFDCSDDDVFNFDDDSDCSSGEDDLSLYRFDDDDEETEGVLGPPKPNIPRKRLIEGLTLEWTTFENRTFSHFQLSKFSLYNVTFNNCTLEDIDCQDGRFVACIFENCEILSFSGEGYAFRECEFTKCKFGGIQYVDGAYHISNCKHTDCTTDYDEE